MSYHAEAIIRLFKLFQSVEVIRIRSRAQTGRSQPFICDCQSPSGNTFQAYVKFAGLHNELGERSIACELISNRIAFEKGLNCPEPYIAEIETDDIKEYLDYSEQSSDFKPTHSEKIFGFCSPALDQQFYRWNTGSKLTKTQLPEALKAYLFDVMTANFDRCFHNPNTLVNSENKFVLIDFEKCFCEIIDGKFEPWRDENCWFRHQGETQHIFYQSLFRQINSTLISSTIANLLDLNIEEIKLYIKQTEEIWGDLNLNKIIDYLGLLGENKAGFEHQAELVLLK